MAINKGSELHHRGEFLHNYYTFESVHDGDHDRVVGILSCEPWLFTYVINYITCTVHNFSPTRSVIWIIERATHD